MVNMSFKKYIMLMVFCLLIGMTALIGVIVKGNVAEITSTLSLLLTTIIGFVVKVDSTDTKTKE